jgi:hypothetical protein
MNSLIVLSNREACQSLGVIYAESASQGAPQEAREKGGAEWGALGRYGAVGNGGPWLV